MIYLGAITSAFLRSLQATDTFLLGQWQEASDFTMPLWSKRKEGQTTLKQYPPRNLREGIIKSENPLPRYASEQKSVTDGQTETLRADNPKKIPPPPRNLSAGDNKLLYQVLSGQVS